MMVVDDGSGARAATAPLPSDTWRGADSTLDTCANCGAELPAGARFCPNCAAPVPREGSEEPPPEKRRGRLANVAFALLLLLNLAVITFAVLVFGFGLFVET